MHLDNIEAFRLLCSRMLHPFVTIWPRWPTQTFGANWRPASTEDTEERICSWFGLFCCTKHQYLEVRGLPLEKAPVQFWYDSFDVCLINPSLALWNWAVLTPVHLEGFKNVRYDKPLRFGVLVANRKDLSQAWDKEGYSIACGSRGNYQGILAGELISSH